MVLSCYGLSASGIARGHPGLAVVLAAGKTATVICENNCFRVVIDGETAAVVPRTTTSEVHPYKANATDKRSLTRLTPEGR
jgi:hypothetical protein